MLPISPRAPTEDRRLTATNVRHDRPQVTVTYQLLRSTLVDQPTGAAASLIAARGLALDWLAGAYPWVRQSPMAMGGGDYRSPDDTPGRHLEIITDQADGLWTARVEHPDLGHGDAVPPIAGRTWVTDISLHLVGADVRVGMRVACASLPGAGDPPGSDRPTLVRQWAQRLGLRDVRPLTATPWRVEFPGDMEAMRDLVENPARELPVVVLTRPEPRQDGLRLAEWLLDHDYLARELHGYAHVLLLPKSTTHAWSSMVGKTWSAYAGAVRVFLPGLRIDEQSPFQHPLTLVDEIIACSDGDLRSERAFTARLRRQIQHPPTQPAAQREHDRVFVPEARTRAAAARHARAVAALLDARQTGGISSELLALITDRMLAIQEAHQAEIHALRSQVTEALNTAIEYETAWTQAEAARAETVHQAAGLKMQLLQTRSLLEPTPEEAALPASYEDIPGWVARTFPGRVILHPRAQRALKDAVYEDIGLVVSALRLLGEEYCAMRLRGGADARDRFESCCAALGLTYGGSISANRRGTNDDEYSVRWPLTGRRRTLDTHLRKGVARDPRHCLAIYFFWDEDDGCVVVGWLPSHLTNRLT